MKRITIAIDGYSSCGKSTLAKQLALELGYTYIDSGAMYRAATLYMLENDISSDNIQAIVAALKYIKIEFRINPLNGLQETYLNEGNVEREIRTLQISNLVSPMSSIAEVRQAMVAQQQYMGKSKGVVMDGRDIGTVVFPDAELKLFMTAEPRIRAQRRFEELMAKGDGVSFDEVYQNVLSRDLIDSTRKVGPLVKSHEAIEINNSHISREQQLNLALNYALKAIASNHIRKG
jgi:cytidylate kinase